jgi:hypothetical protein
MSKVKKEAKRGAKPGKDDSPTKLTGQKLLNAIAADMKNVAENIDLDPGMLTSSKYYSGGGYFNDWQMRKVGGFNAIKKLFYEADLPKDRATVGEVKDLRKKFMKSERELDSREMFVARLNESISQMAPIKVAPYKPKNAYKPVKRVVNLLLSDLHFGSDLEREETGTKWGKVEEARCFARIVKNVCAYKTHYRPETKLVASIIGDIIENELHDTSTAAPIHEQACRAIHLLTQGIAQFSANFREVEINFAVGNHGRDKAIHFGRATSMKWNAIETTIYYAVKNACKHMKNVKFFQPLTPWAVYEACGHKVYVTHGDTNLNVGNPGNTISIRSLETQINRLNSSLKDDEKYAIFAIGHVHLALSTQLPNGAFLIMNGPLVPPNSFAQTLGIMKSPQNQVMWESTPDFAVGDQRFINAAGAESDASLDKIITPFIGIDV